MPQAVTVYKWDDDGAPQLTNGKPSEIINVLKKVLVEGYGVKAPLGWSMPFEDSVNFKAAFKNNTADGGSGGYALIYSNTGLDSNAAAMRIRSSKAMSAIDTSLGDGFTQAFQFGAGSGADKVSKWYIIGNSKAFYLIGGFEGRGLDGGSYYTPSIFVGDFLSAIPADAGRFIALAAHSYADFTSASYQATLSALHLTEPINCLRINAPDNSAANKVYTLINTGVVYSWGQVSNGLNPYRSLIPIQIRTLKSGPSSSAIAESTVEPYFRGLLPGIYICTAPFGNNSPSPSVIDIAGKGYWILQSVWGCPAVVIASEVWDDY